MSNIENKTPSRVLFTKNNIPAKDKGLIFLQVMVFLFELSPLPDNKVLGTKHKRLLWNEILGKMVTVSPKVHNQTMPCNDCPQIAF